MTYPQTTVSVSIEVAASKVYDFVSNGANLPNWATGFCLSVEPDGGDWRVQTPQGPLAIRLAGRNAFGILDHTVIPPEGESLHVPMRVIPNGSGCEVFFTLFRLPFMSEERYAADLGFVRQDLKTLKKIMERD